MNAPKIWWSESVGSYVIENHDGGYWEIGTASPQFFPKLPINAELMIPANRLFYVARSAVLYGVAGTINDPHGITKDEALECAADYFRSVSEDLS